MRNSTPPMAGTRRRLLSQRFLLSTLVLTVLGLLALIQAYTIQRSGVHQAEFARGGILTQARLAAAAHDQWLAESRNLLAAMASALDALPAGGGACTGLFNRFIARADDFDTVLLANPDGDLVCAPAPVTRRVNFAERSYFRRAISTGEFSVGDYIIGRISGKRVLPVALPQIDASGSIRSVLIAERELDWPGTILKRQGVFSAARVTILDENGTVLRQYPDGGAVERERSFLDPGVLDAVRSKPTGVVETSALGDETQLIGFTRLDHVSGNVVVLISIAKEAALRPVGDYTRRSNLFLALTLSVVLITLWAGLAVIVLYPVERLRQAMRKASHGDLSVRLGDMGVSAEMRDVSSAFDTMVSALGEARAHLEQLAAVDPLLNIANRRKFNETLNSEWFRARRTGHSLALLMIDLDLFKKYNDRYGHPGGDECLRRVARAVGDALRRPGDLLARYGGEELVCVLPGTELSGATVVAKTIRQKVKDENIVHEDGIGGRVTISIGAAVAVPDETCSPSDLVDAADRALYIAKDGGRDTVSFASLEIGLRGTGGGGRA